MIGLDLGSSLTYTPSIHQVLNSCCERACMRAYKVMLCVFADCGTQRNRIEGKICQRMWVFFCCPFSLKRTGEGCMSRANYKYAHNGRQRSNFNLADICYSWGLLMVMYHKMYRTLLGPCSNRRDFFFFKMHPASA